MTEQAFELNFKELYLSIYQILSHLWFTKYLSKLLRMPFSFHRCYSNDYCLLMIQPCDSSRVFIMTLLSGYSFPMKVYLNNKKKKEERKKDPHFYFAEMASQVSCTGYTLTKCLLMMLMILWVTHAYSTGPKKPHTCLFVQKWKK